VKFNSELGNTYIIPTNTNSASNSVHSLHTAPNQSNLITLTNHSIFNSTFKNRSTSKSLKIESKAFSTTGEKKKFNRNYMENQDVYSKTTSLNFNNINKKNNFQKSPKTQKVPKLPKLNTNNKLIADE
jgi:hypothetical protein